MTYDAEPVTECNRESYGWLEVRRDLEEGVAPKIVASRLGEPVAYVLEVAEQQGWSVVWKGPTPDQILDAHERADS